MPPRSSLRAHPVPFRGLQVHNSGPHSLQEAWCSDSCPWVHHYGCTEVSLSSAFSSWTPADGRPCMQPPGPTYHPAPKCALLKTGSWKLIRIRMGQGALGNCRVGAQATMFTKILFLLLNLLYVYISALQLRGFRCILCQSMGVTIIKYLI